MGSGFTLQERCALYGLLAQDNEDIVIKTDRRGFVTSASGALTRLGYGLPELLIGPHIADLARADYGEALGAAFEAAIGGGRSPGWIEFPARCSRRKDPVWYEMQLHGLSDPANRRYGTLGVMRSIAARKTLEERLFAAEHTDPLTGLTNRRAFITMLDHLIGSGPGGCLALFDIDHFMAINMRCGQAAGDEVLVVFADLLRAVLRHDDIVSRVGAERFAVLLPGVDPAQAMEICDPVIATLTDIRRLTGTGDLAISASAGLSPIAGSLDLTLKRAELALFFAKAKGRSRLELGEPGVELRQTYA
jgi:diguanylate cyclase (GGDEF)-like protein/PAS domain S-box-containing protein